MGIKSTKAAFALSTKAVSTKAVLHNDDNAGEETSDSQNEMMHLDAKPQLKFFCMNGVMACNVNSYI